MQDYQDHYSLFEDFDKKYKILLKYDKYYMNEELLYSFMRDFKIALYDIIHNQLEPKKEIKENEEMIRLYCKYINEKILPLCNKKIDTLSKRLKIATEKFLLEEKQNLNANLSRWLDLEDDYYALSCYRNLVNFAFYLERGKPLKKKVWDKTMPIFEGLFNYMQQMVFEEDSIDLIRASYFPGAGKTFAANLLIAYWFGYDINISFLRITYSDDLVQSFTGQIQNIIGSDRYKKVFPYFNKQDKDLYKKKNTDTIWFKGCETVNFYARTRDGQSTGKRAKVLIIDDITKGRDEAYKIDLHVKIVGKYDFDWTSRADDDDQKIIALGTMWSRFDLLNIIQKRDEAKGALVIDEKYKYAKKSVNGKSIYISVPALDYDTDESTCPLRYSTQYFRDKRDNPESIDKTLFSAVYQQVPEEPEDLLFGYSRIRTYNGNTFPKEILEGNYECRCQIDPNRKGFDYFVALFFKRYEIERKVYSKWYLVDCICRRKPYKLLKNDLTEKIIKNNVSKLGVEINTSNELGDYIKDELKRAGYTKIKIDEIYSTENKEEKISANQDEILTELIFPEKNMFSPSSEMGIAMDMLTTYSTTTTNAHDDVPDCCATFTENNIGVDLENETKILSVKCRL